MINYKLRSDINHLLLPISLLPPSVMKQNRLGSPHLNLALRNSSISEVKEEVPAIQANEIGGHLGQPVIRLENASSQVKSGIRLDQVKPGIGSKNVNQIHPVVTTASQVNEIGALFDKQVIPVITVSTGPNEHPTRG